MKLRFLAFLCGCENQWLQNTDLITDLSCECLANDETTNLPKTSNNILVLTTITTTVVTTRDGTTVIVTNHQKLSITDYKILIYCFIAVGIVAVSAISACCLMKMHAMQIAPIRGGGRRSQMSSRHSSYISFYSENISTPSAISRNTFRLSSIHSKSDADSFDYV